MSLFHEARRVLRSDGTFWLNYGDCYATAPNGRSAADTKAVGNDDRTFRDKPFSTIGGALKPKDLAMLPHRLAIALQDDGWWVRADIVWAKPNPMPESITDRPTKSHEYVFLLAKSERYWYDAEAIREPHSDKKWIEGALSGRWTRKTDAKVDASRNDGSAMSAGTSYAATINPAGRNKRSVWTVATEPTPEAHFATFPKKLIEPMILAGCPATVCAECGAPWERVTEREPSYDHVTTANGKSKDGPYAAQTGNGKGTHDIRHGVYSNVTTLGFRPTCTCNAATDAGIVLDPFFGSGTTGLVARRWGRHFLGCELNPEYVAMANRRLAQPFMTDMYAQAVMT